MNLIKPKKLQKGDTIAIIATSGDVDIKKINKAKTYIESLGYKVKLGSNIKKKEFYLAGNDKQRLKDLHEAFLDDEVKAIICARGGYGSIRIINDINYKIIKDNPKIICGYSDISALLTMITKNTGLVTFLGPMAQPDFGIDEIDKYTQNSLFNALTNNDITIEPITNNTINSKTCEGVLFGGNLTTICSLCGQDFVPDTNFIFIAEDLNEPTYKIDRCFTQLFNINQFKNNIRAIIIGEFLDIDNKEAFIYMLENLSKKYNLPIFMTYPISHNKTKATVPIGAVARIEKETIKIANFTA